MKYHRLGTQVSMRLFYIFLQYGSYSAVSPLNRQEIQLRFLTLSGVSGHVVLRPTHFGITILFVLINLTVDLLWKIDHPYLIIFLGCSFFTTYIFNTKFQNSTATAVEFWILIFDKYQYLFNTKFQKAKFGRGSGRMLIFEFCQVPLFI